MNRRKTRRDSGHQRTTSYIVVTPSTVCEVNVTTYSLLHKNVCEVNVTTYSLLHKNVLRSADDCLLHANHWRWNSVRFRIDWVVFPGRECIVKRMTITGHIAYPHLSIHCSLRMIEICPQGDQTDRQNRPITATNHWNNRNIDDCRRCGCMISRQLPYYPVVDSVSRCDRVSRLEA